MRVAYSLLGYIPLKLYSTALTILMATTRLNCQNPPGGDIIENAELKRKMATRLRNQEGIKKGELARNSEGSLIPRLGRHETS